MYIYTGISMMEVICCAFKHNIVEIQNQSSSSMYGCTPLFVIMPNKIINIHIEGAMVNKFVLCL